MKLAIAAWVSLTALALGACAHGTKTEAPPPPAAATAPVAAVAAAPVPPAAAVPAVAPAAEYVTLAMQIDVNKPAAETWAKVGGYCDLATWFANPLYCKVISGDGGIGTVRAFNPEGTSTEVLTAKTDLAYGYTQPLKPGTPYNLYHGFLEAKPLTATTTRLHYTLVYDVSMLANQAAKDADVARRRTAFEGALVKMKAIAEGQ